MEMEEGALDEEITFWRKDINKFDPEDGCWTAIADIILDVQKEIEAKTTASA